MKISITPPLPASLIHTGPAPEPCPGSREAIIAGCLCPIPENNAGAGCLMAPAWNPTSFTVHLIPLFRRHAECPLHGEQALARLPDGNGAIPPHTPSNTSA